MSFETLIWGTKLVHVAAIALWVGGLLSIPYLVWQRRGLLREQGRAAVHRLHRIVRLVHVGVTSPAAVVAVISGIALIFLRQTWDSWFTLKLVFVGVLVVAHNVANRVQRKVFADDPLDGSSRSEAEHGELPGPAALGLGVTIAVGALGVLVTVLAKPPIDLSGLAPDLLRPGALGPILLGDFNPWGTP